jgi:polar amino acid transport system substrate-binding protein
VFEDLEGFGTRPTSWAKGEARGANSSLARIACGLVWCGIWAERACIRDRARRKAARWHDWHHGAWRRGKADSTADLWIISLVYVAAPGKEFPDIASVDKAGVKIGTISGAPSDRVLTREIKAAEIVRIPLSPTIANDAAELLRSGKADVFGADSGVGYPAAEALPGARVVPGAFATVRVAAALPKSRSAAAQAAVATLIEEAKQTGVVQKAIDAKGLKGVNVATK